MKKNVFTITTAGIIALAAELGCVAEQNKSRVTSFDDSLENLTRQINTNHRFIILYKESPEVAENLRHYFYKHNFTIVYDFGRMTNQEIPIFTIQIPNEEYTTYEKTRKRLLSLEGVIEAAGDMPLQPNKYK